MSYLEENEGRADMFVSAFINGTEWKDEVEALDRMSKITKQQIVDFANKYFGDNYALVYKKQGLPFGNPCWLFVLLFLFIVCFTFLLINAEYSIMGIASITTPWIKNEDR